MTDTLQRIPPIPASAGPRAASYRHNEQACEGSPRLPQRPSRVAHGKVSTWQS